MIITHISADNLLKYRHLELADLPRQGVITISGQNESGKSSIGETVCFALFGRTFSIDDDDITRVIRWGETRCSVRLGFAVGGDEYEIARFLDSEGNHGVRLYRKGEEDRPIAKGINTVSEALDELLGYQFEEFVESFYLAQREITTPHPHSHAIKTMAGISALERVAEDLQQDISNETRRLPDVAEQIELVEVDLNALAIEPDQLSDLQSRHQSIEQAGTILRERSDGLDQAAGNYRDVLPRIRSARGFKRLFGLFTFIALLAAVAAGGAWYLLHKMPDSPYAEQLRALLQEYVPTWSDQYIAQLDIAFAVLSATFLLLWLVTRLLGRKVKTLKKHGDTLADQLLAAQAPVPEITQDAAVSDEDTEDNDEAIEAEGIAADAPAAIESSDLDGIRRCRLDIGRTDHLLESTRQQLDNRMLLQQNMQDMLESSISHEQDRLSKASALEGVISNLREKLDEHKRRIQLREMADELIASAARHISQRFNKDLRELASSTLPLFTEGRYEHLHIDNDLNVRAFSSLKRDFMDLDEISSGTQRQIMLAVRLALSQELVNTTIGGDQFIFLDEPFAFFDETRTRNAMAILPKLSDEIRQIWVVAQTFPDDTQYDRAIVCSRDYESLPPA
jgi:exonuclease SbcC